MCNIKSACAAKHKNSFTSKPIKIRRVEFSRSIIGFHFNNKTRGLVQLQHYCVPVAPARMDSINAKITFRNNGS